MSNHFSTTRRRNAFTLVEVLVALGILAILLVIIVVPLRLGFDTFHVGKARADTQSALQSTVTSMENDLRQAIYVFPNGKVPGVTDKAPYNAQLPYFRSTDPTDTGTPTTGACATTEVPFENRSRIDMIQVRRNDQGDVETPLAPAYTVVTYYARRLDMTKDYDPIDNPLVMFRAEYPAYGLVGTDPQPLKVASPTNALNAQIDFDRNKTAACTASAPIANRNAQWLSHNVYGEANLEPLTHLGNPIDPDAAEFDPATGFTTDDSLYSHTLATPRGLALEASRAYRSLPSPTPVLDTTNEAPLVPDTSFTETDTNGDGKIDRVTISLGLASFDVGAQGQFNTTTNQPRGTRLPATRTIDLPNIQ